ncbi:hypothetical protein IP84_09660 [beta proteobacterium AAP99]|nr:hypothetical protein IP84_09660 [beta proteobacterium AAP99]
MSLAATCPQCHTLFRVVPDQLKLRGGMVRCGACQHVFNANLSLSFVAEDAIALRRRAQRLDAARTPRPAVPSNEPPQPARPVDELAPTGSEYTAESVDRPNTLERPSIAAFAEQRSASARADPQADDHALAVAAQQSAEPTAVDVEATSRATEVDAARFARREQRMARAKALREMQRAADTHADAPKLNLAADGASAVHADSTPVAGSEAAQAAEPAAPVLLSAIDTQDLAAAFLAREQAAERRTRRWRRAAAAGSVLALVALSAQLAYAMRDEIAQMQPAAKPALSAACDWLGCSVTLPRHARALSLESIQLEALDRNGHYRVSTVLRNTGSVTTAAPHLEISFPNKSDGLLARKVLAPEQWLPETVVRDGIAPGAEVSARFGLESSLELLGYTAAVFYP